MIKTNISTLEVFLAPLGVTIAIILAQVYCVLTTYQTLWRAFIGVISFKTYSNSHGRCYHPRFIDEATHLKLASDDPNSLLNPTLCLLSNCIPSAECDSILNLWYWTLRDFLTLPAFTLHFLRSLTFTLVGNHSQLCLKSPTPLSYPQSQVIILLPTLLRKYNQKRNSESAYFAFPLVT